MAWGCGIGDVTGLGGSGYFPNAPYIPIWAVSGLFYLSVCLISMKQIQANGSRAWTYCSQQDVVSQHSNVCERTVGSLKPLCEQSLGWWTDCWPWRCLASSHTVNGAVSVCFYCICAGFLKSCFHSYYGYGNMEGRSIIQMFSLFITAVSQYLDEICYKAAFLSYKYKMFLCSL